MIFEFTPRCSHNRHDNFGNIFQAKAQLGIFEEEILIRTLPFCDKVPNFQTIIESIPDTNNIF